MNTGIVYIVTGRGDSGQQCAVSVESLRIQGYAGPIHVVADRVAYDAGLVDFANSGRFDPCRVHLPEDAEDWPEGVWRSRHLKTQAFFLVPYYNITAMLDCDTVAIRPIDGLFNAFPACGFCGRKDWHSSNCQNLNKPLPEVAAALDPIWPYLPVDRPDFLSPEEWAATVEATQCGPTECRYWNAGVLVWRRSFNAERLFKRWYEEWQRFGTYDQFAFFRAVRRLSVEVKTLPPVFNTFDKSRMENPGSTAIVHFAGQGAERSPAMRAIMEAFTPGHGAGYMRGK